MFSLQYQMVVHNDSIWIKKTIFSFYDETFHFPTTGPPISHTYKDSVLQIYKSIFEWIAPTFLFLIWKKWPKKHHLIFSFYHKACTLAQILSINQNFCDFLEKDDKKRILIHFEGYDYISVFCSGGKLFATLIFRYFPDPPQPVTSSTWYQPTSWLKYALSCSHALPETQLKIKIQ